MKTQDKKTFFHGQLGMMNQTVLSYLKKNKSRNLLIGIAIALTALLLTAAPTIIAGYISIQEQAVMELYPTFHAMFRGADGKTAEELMADERVEQAGLREDAAVMCCADRDAEISLLAIDETAARLARQETLKGRLPEKADEIVVSEGILNLLNQEGDVGARIEAAVLPNRKGGSKLRLSREFTIVGMIEDNEISEREGTYFAFVSDAFAEEILPAGERKYRVYLRLNGAGEMVTDDIAKQIELLGEEYGIQKKRILINKEYLSAAYVDPATYKALGVIMCIVALVGALTIYSIYCVSMLDKVQEYGRLRAIGATKRQIRKLVFREGFAVAAAAIPAGIILGLLTGILIVRITTGISAGNGDMLFGQMKQVLERREVSLVKPWALACAASVSFLTVWLSLLKPMHTAGKITAMEALRYQGKEKFGKKVRRGYRELNTRKLAVTNLKRNKRRTVITIFALGVTGSLFLTVATICSCMEPETMARQELRGDIQISVDAYGDNEMYPERSLRNIQKNNPLTKELKEQILEVDGVQDIDVDYAVAAGLLGVEEEDGRPLETGITGISETAFEALRPYVTEGSLDNPALREGRGILLGERLRGHFPEMKDWGVGTKIRMLVAEGDRDVEREFEIAALMDGPASLGGTYLTMPADALQSLSETDLTDCYEITVEDGKEEAAAAEVEALVKSREFLEMKTYEEVYEEEKRGVMLIRCGCYGLLLVFGLIGILNLVNTMINSVYARRKELGMLQAIGMSGRQTLNMLQMEGLFYTAGTLAVSLGLGSLLGYWLFLWAKTEGIMSIKTYRYPLLSAAVLTAVVLAVQLLITYLVNIPLKKQSLIDRIRFAE